MHLVLRVFNNLYKTDQEACKKKTINSIWYLKKKCKFDDLHLQHKSNIYNFGLNNIAWGIVVQYLFSYLDFVTKT